MEDLIPIGQFARASRLSPKALRLYDENGLLPPARVDPDSGYRFYRLEQLREATLIGLLRSAGMPLARIRRVLEDPAPVRIDEYEAALADELAERRRILDYVRRFLKEEHMFEVKTKHVDEQPYESRSKQVRVAELEPFIRETIAALTAEHEAAGHAFAVYHGEVSDAADGPVEVGLPVARAEKTLPGGEVAYTVVEGSETDYPEILGAYDAVAIWAKANGRELTGPPREVYLSEEKFEITWPLR